MKFVFCAAIGDFQIRAKEISGCDNKVPDFLSRWEENPKNSEIFYFSVADLNLDLSGFYVTDDFFRFTHDW